MQRTSSIKLRYFKTFHTRLDKSIPTRTKQSGLEAYTESEEMAITSKLLGSDTLGVILTLICSFFQKCKSHISPIKGMMKCNIL